MTIKFTNKLDPNKLARTLGKRYKLTPHLDRVFDTFDKPFEFVYKDKESDNAWHPSGHCMPPAGVLYDIAKPKDYEAKDVISGSLRKAFLVGHFWHQLLQHIVLEELAFCEPGDIERQGFSAWNNGEEPNAERGKPNPYHWATGAGDIAPCHIPRHGDYVVDFKTMGSGQFKQNGVPAWAANKYEAQINIYMSFFDLEKALIVAINKDTGHEFKEFEYVRNQLLIDMIFTKWEFVSHCLDEGTPPTLLEDDHYSLDGFFKGPVAV